MKVRLILRAGVADADGRCVQYEYLTTVVEMNVKGKPLDFRPEIVGGEYLSNDSKGE